MRFGVHCSIAGGVENAPGRAAGFGCDCFQFFVANPRAWRLPAIPPASVEAFRVARAAAGLGPAIVHMTYLPNLASPDRALCRKSVRHCRAQVAAAAALGAEFFVLHPGSRRGGDAAAAIARVGAGLREALDAAPDGPVLLLENTAGGGGTLGRSPDGLAALADAVDAPGRVGLCLDTCHAWAAGANVGRRGALARLLRAHEDAAGAGTVRLIHANDSRDPLGGGRDRHWHVGLGTIGETGFRNLLRCRAARGLPWILETPVDATRGDADNLAAVRALASKKG